MTRTLPTFGQHPLGVREPASYACPEHPIGQAQALCRWCLGTGLLSLERLAAYQADQNRLIAGVG